MEIWKEIKGYEGYEISSTGRVKSLKGKYERILKSAINMHGYYFVGLSKNGKVTTKKVHQLVAIAFLNHVPNGFILVINHINIDKLDNRVENLEIVTMRENSNQKHLKSSSKYIGVCWHKGCKKWQSIIKINGKQKHLGLFVNEIEASNAYQKALKNP